MRSACWKIGVLIIVLLEIGSPVKAADTTLFDGALGTSPSAQGWLHPTILGGTETVGATSTTFDTSANAAIQNGYSLTAPTALDRSGGYTLHFDLGITNESHTSADRSGVSLIVIGNDLQGIELGFWDDRIWAQNTGFTHGEEALIDTLSGVRQYDLFVQGTAYRLSSGGTDLLSGDLRDYSARGLVYDQSNFLFIGDDTKEASGGFEWQNASLSVNSVTVPESGTVTLLLSGALALLATCIILSRRQQCFRQS